MDSRLLTMDCRQITLACADLRKRVIVTLSFLVATVIVEWYPLLLQILILNLLLHNIVPKKFVSVIWRKTFPVIGEKMRSSRFTDKLKEIKVNKQTVIEGNCSYNY